MHDTRAVVGGGVVGQEDGGQALVAVLACACIGYVVQRVFEVEPAEVFAQCGGQHVQKSLGTLEKVNALRARSSQKESNALSVRVELQADCYAGVWARAVQDRFGVLEPGDVQDALNTAARIGDDALQQAQRGIVVPDSFTHGSSEQRQRWFYNGFNSGDPGACDTFGANAL